MSRGQRRADPGEDALFIYDGDCGFCRKWAGWLEQRVCADVRFSSFQELGDLTPLGLTVDDVQTASCLIEHGCPYRGGRGIARAMARGRGVWKFIGLVLDLWGVRAASALGYKLVARNRHRLPAPDREVTT
jgi:predicted DCC family thiol-disulfide oxidoreductase YuxK